MGALDMFLPARLGGTESCLCMFMSELCFVKQHMRGMSPFQGVIGWKTEPGQLVEGHAALHMQGLARDVARIQEQTH